MYLFIVEELQKSILNNHNIKSAMAKVDEAE